MRLWGRFRSLRWYWRVPLGAAALLTAAVLLHVGVRSLQYAMAEKDPSLYVPADSNIVARLRDFEGQAGRIGETVAWRVLERKILRDPGARKALNALLKSAGAPTLDDLEDRRKSSTRNLPWALEALGKDALAAARVTEVPAQTKVCGILRLRWWHFLLSPCAGWVLPSEPAGGEGLLRLRLGKKDLYLAFRGALALVSTDREFLGQALRRRGAAAPGRAPLEARVIFDGSPGLLDLRRALQACGAFPYVRFDSLRGLAVSLDVDGPTLRLEALLEKAEPLLGTPVPSALRAWAPESSTGCFATNTGAKDLIGWIRELALDGGPKDAGRRNLLQALELLDDAGLSSAFLPKTEPGMLIVTGMEEREGRVYPAFALVLPSRDPRGAVDAMNALVRKRAGKWAEKSNRIERPLEDTRLYSWRWPDALEINDILRPTYAALKDAFVIGNNEGFTEQLVRTAAQGGGLETTPNHRRLLGRLKDTGFAAEPGIAGGFLWPPLLRESLDGLLVHVTRQVVASTLEPAKHRAAVVAELKARLGREPQEAEIVAEYNDSFARLKVEREEALKNDLRALDFVKWLAFEANPSSKGILFRLALELR